MSTVEALGLTIALTQLFKDAMGWEGGKAQVLGTIIGLILGFVSSTSAQIPVDYPGWVAAVTTGLGVGLAAVGLYKVGSNFAAKSGFSQVINTTGEVGVTEE